MENMVTTYKMPFQEYVGVSYVTGNAGSKGQVIEGNSGGRWK